LLRSLVVGPGQGEGRAADKGKLLQISSNHPAHN
jgi:hypothetical protein